MKVLTKEEEQAHYMYVPHHRLALSPMNDSRLKNDSNGNRATVKGGSIGGIIGLALGGAGLAVANKRIPSVRALTVPFKAFLVSSAGTFTGIF